MRIDAGLMRLLAFAFGLLVCFNAAAQAPAAGNLVLLTGSARALSPAGVARPLAKGDAVYSGDAIDTAEGSYALIKFSDQGTVMVRPGSRLVIESYRYNAAPAPAAPAGEPAAPSAAPLPLQTTAPPPESAFFRLVKGSLRAVSGLIAHADYGRYRVSTPVATMGIRGTDFIVAECDTACMNDPEVLKALPPGATPQGAVVSGVYDGEITVTSYTGNTLTLHAGQFAITLADGSQYLLGLEPAFLTSEAGAGAAESAGAAGNVNAAQSSASGLVVGSIIGAGAAIVLGVVLSSTGGGTTGTTGTTAPAH